ncbi:hypothetical protein ABT237_30385 [Streptomyces sp. NPDC001581]|uniref:hypothetical protein n=1 Tax=Streptomyces sp. NPDC001581 TaxID=3154386 RepID=UPI00331FDB79
MDSPGVQPPEIHPGGVNTDCSNTPQRRIADWLALDVRDLVARNFRTLPAPGSWGLMGVSTGGFCAAKLPLQYPKDKDSPPRQLEAFAKAAGSGVRVKTLVRPAGGHNFRTWTGMYPDAMGWLSTELAPPSARQSTPSAGRGAPAASLPGTPPECTGRHPRLACVTRPATARWATSPSTRMEAPRCAVPGSSPSRV